jgi:hypothetical protein
VSIAAPEPPPTAIASSAVRPTAGRRRLCDRRRETRGPGRSLVVDHGCDVRIAHVRLEPATVLALLEWLPIAHGEIAFLERGEPADPVAAVGLVLRPPTIWSPAEALAARAGAHGAGSVEFHAAHHVAPLHLRRLRRAAARIATQLPLVGLQRASELVVEGCAIVVCDPAACADAAAAQLVRYATSDLIQRISARRREDGAKP